MMETAAAAARPTRSVVPLISQLPIEVWLEVLSHFSHVREMLATHRALSLASRFLARVSNHGAVWSQRLRLMESHLRRHNRFVPFAHTDYAAVRKRLDASGSSSTGSSLTSTRGAVEFDQSAAAAVAAATRVLLPDWASCFLHCYVAVSQRCLICMKPPGAANSPLSAFDEAKFSGPSAPKTQPQQSDGEASSGETLLRGQASSSPPGSPLLQTSALLLRFPLSHLNICMVCLRYHFVTLDQLRSAVAEIVAEKTRSATSSVVPVTASCQKSVAVFAPRFKLHRWSVVPRVWIEHFVGSANAGAEQQSPCNSRKRAGTVECDDDNTPALAKTNGSRGGEATTAIASSTTTATTATDQSLESSAGSSSSSELGRVIARALHSQHVMLKVQEQESTRHLHSPCDPLHIVQSQSPLYFAALAEAQTASSTLRDGKNP